MTIEKIRKFYHRLNGCPSLPTSKVPKIYLDEDYRKSINKDDIPEDEFVSMYINAITNIPSSTTEMLINIETLFNYAIRSVNLDSKEYRILIKSRNLSIRSKI